VVGRFQRADWEVDADACARHGVRVWRRFTGGGAVYLDAGVLCAALVTPAGHPWAARGVPELYAPLLDGLVRTCRLVGVPAQRDERAARVGGRKVSGIAAHRGRAGTIVHGTLLVSADLEALDACLAGPRGGDLGGRPRPAASRPDTVANVDRVGVEDALAAAFGATRDAPTEAEAALAARLAGERYADPAWHLGPWAEVTPAVVAALVGPGA
jgi:lipoate-protein ligase A